MWGPDKSNPKSLLSYLLHLLGLVNLSGHIFMYLLFLVLENVKVITPKYSQNYYLYELRTKAYTRILWGKNNKGLL